MARLSQEEIIKKNKKNRKARAARMAKRKKELQENKKKELKKNAQEIANEVQELIIDHDTGNVKTEPLALNPIVQEALQPIVVPEERIGSREFCETADKQMESLTVKILALDETMDENSQKIYKIKTQLRHLEREKHRIEEAIRRDQDRMYKNNNKLSTILDETEKTRVLHPDTHWVVRRTLEILTLKPDEMLIRSRLSNDEYKLKQRGEQLYNIQSQVSKLFIALQFKEAYGENIKQCCSKFRTLRSHLGTSKRNVEDAIQRREAETRLKALISKFFDDFQKIQKVKEKFISNMTNRIDQILNILPNSDNLMSFDVDNIISSVELGADSDPKETKTNKKE